MNPYTLSLRPIAISLAVGLLLAACGAGSEEATPTFTVEQIQTQAVATFSAELTSTALAMPTSTPTATETPTSTQTSTPAVTSTPVATAVVTIPAESCNGLAFVSDVSIPDNTSMTSEQTFTKTWRVRNSGTCPWQAGFKLNFTSGEAMGGSSVSLAGDVQPGNEINVSVPMTSPNTAGTYRGNWRMTDAIGTYFGDEVYVLIIVGGSTATVTPNASAIPTLAATATPTPTSTETATP